jgi:chromosome segregation ATPase
MTGEIIKMLRNKGNLHNKKKRDKIIVRIDECINKCSEFYEYYMYEEMDKLRDDMKNEIHNLEIKIDQKINNLEKRMNDKIEDLETKMNQMESELKNNIHNLETKMDRMENEIHNLKRDINEIHNELMDLKWQYKKLEFKYNEFNMRMHARPFENVRISSGRSKHNVCLGGVWGARKDKSGTYGRF